MRAPFKKYAFFLLTLLAALSAVFLLRSREDAGPKAPGATQVPSVPVFFTNRLDTLLAAEPPVAAHAGGRFFVATSAENEEPLVRVLDGKGQIVSRHPVTGLGGTVQACAWGENAALFSEDAFVALASDGTPGPAVRLVDSPPGIKTYSIEEGVLALVSVEPGAAVYFRAYRLDGSPVREGASFAAPGAPLVRAGLARLGTGEYLVVWIDAGRVRYAVVSVVGEIKMEPVTFAEPAGGARSLSVAPDGSGNARVVWEEDSDAGGIFVRRAWRDGAIGDVLALGEKGSSSPRLLRGGDLEAVAWVGGKNNEVLFLASNGGRTSRLTAPGPIEAFDGAISGNSAMLTATVRENDAYAVYAGVLES